MTVGWSVGATVGNPVGMEVRQIPLDASQTSDRQSLPLAQPSPTPHAGHPPPQSTSDSSPFWRPSVQLRSVGIGVGSGIGTGVGAGIGTGVGGGVGTDVGEGVGAGIGTRVGATVGKLDGIGVGSGDGSGVGCDEIVGAGVGSGVGTGDGMCVSTDMTVTESDASDESPAAAASDAIDDASAPEEAAALTVLLSSLTYAPLSSDSTVCALAVIVSPS